MKKVFTLLFLILCCFNIYAQKRYLNSNGYNSTFTKVDTLFFNEYAGQKTKLQLKLTDSSLSNSILQFDSSFGVITHNSEETKAINIKFSTSKKLLSTSFYAYTDGTLQAPTSTLFFQPKNQSSVNKNFKQFGIVVTHPDFKGFYYLHLNTAIYNTGDKIINLCDSLYQQKLALTIEPVFVRLNVFSDDPRYPDQWNIENTGQYGGTPGADMHVSDTWCLGYSGLGIKVAVIDEGVDLNHPDLQSRLLAGYDATGNNSAGACAAGDTHGTSCAGIIAEANNNIGGQGVAFRAKIIPIRVGMGGIITDTWAANGINWAVSHGADVLSNSWGRYGSPASQLDQAIQNAVQNGRSGKGSLVVFAVGNFNYNVSYPASNSNTIAVGASCECDTRKRSSNDPNEVNPGVHTDPLGTSCDGEFGWGSNFGTGLDVMAPGVWITTTTNGVNGNYTNAYVNNFSGTSAACPNTAAVLALILSVNPSLTGQAARNILESTCENVGGYAYQSNVSGQPNGTWSIDAGYGRVNAFSAVSKAINSITDIHGADNFCSSSTYTITPPTGLTVSSWSVTPSGIVSLSPNGDSVTLTKVANGTVTLKAKLNSQCRGGVIISKPVTVGIPSQPGPITVILVDYHLGKLQVQIDPVFGATSYNWYKDGVLQTTSQGTFIQMPITRNLCDVGYGIEVEAINSCGTSAKTYKGVFVPCDGYYYMISPNPASSEITVSSNASKTETTENKTFDEVRVYDFQGILKKQQKFNKVSTATVNTSGLTTGMYLIVIINGNYKERHQVVIQK